MNLVFHISEDGSEIELQHIPYLHAMNLFSDIVLLMPQRVQIRVIMGLYMVESTSIGLTPTLLSMLNFCLTLPWQEVFIFIP